MTIVRPSHTYDRTLLPAEGGYTVIDAAPRQAGASSRRRHFALDADPSPRFRARVRAAARHDAAIGEAFHITSDEALTGSDPRNLGSSRWAKPELVHVPSDLIAAYDPTGVPGCSATSPQHGLRQQQGRSSCQIFARRSRFVGCG